ncbi:MAG: DNA polymerase [Candidatus Thiodiazotropha endolucinida]
MKKILSIFLEFTSLDDVSLEAIHIMENIDGENNYSIYVRGHNLDTGINAINDADKIIGHNIYSHDLVSLRQYYLSSNDIAAVNSLDDKWDCIVDTSIIYPVLLPNPDKTINSKIVEYPNSIVERAIKLKDKLDILKSKTDAKNIQIVLHLQLQLYDALHEIERIIIKSELFRDNCVEKCLKRDSKFASILCRLMSDGFHFDIEGAIALKARFKSEMKDINKSLSISFDRQVNVNNREVLQNALHNKYPTLIPQYDKKNNFFILSNIDSLDIDESIEIKRHLLLKRTYDRFFMTKNSYDKCYVKNTKAIHSTVKVNGTVTGRCTHSAPNISQVPSTNHALGKECRALFKARNNYILYGIDVKSLELSCFAHIATHFGKGSDLNVIFDSDPFCYIQNKLSLKKRDQAKKVLYALFYGAGDETLGRIAYPVLSYSNNNDMSKKGRRLRQLINKEIPVFREVEDELFKRFVGRGFLYSLDGRPLIPLNHRYVFNHLLQSCGAIFMKQFLIELDSALSQSLSNINDYRIVGLFHDEVQIELLKKHENTIDEYVKSALFNTHRILHLRSQFAITINKGADWSQTH